MNPTVPMERNGSTYEIRVKNHLRTCWVTYFEGWTIDNLENGEVLLRNSCVDQSALHGALNRIRDLNLTLVSVTRLEERSRRNAA